MYNFLHTLNTTLTKHGQGVVCDKTFQNIQLKMVSTQRSRSRLTCEITKPQRIAVSQPMLALQIIMKVGSLGQDI